MLWEQPPQEIFIMEIYTRYNKAYYNITPQHIKFNDDIECELMYVYTAKGGIFLYIHKEFSFFSDDDDFFW